MDGNKGKKKKLIWAVAGIIIVAAVILCAFLGNYLVKEKERQEAEARKNMTYEEIASQVSADTASEPDAESSYQSPVNFEELQELNPDAYAWIKIPGTNIDYPIMQKADGDQSYYLNTTMTGLEGFPGSIYTENYNAKDFQDANTLIYGHDLQDGTMFTQLHKYADRNFMAENPYVYIYTPEKMLKYQIYAAVVFDDRHIMMNFDFNNPDSYQQFLNETLELRDMQSVIDTNVPVNNQSKIITMSTCIAERPENRWLVEAVLIDETE